MQHIPTLVFLLVSLCPRLVFLLVSGCPSPDGLAGVSVLWHSPSLGVLGGVSVSWHSPGLDVLGCVSVLWHSPGLGVLAGVNVLWHSPVQDGLMLKWNTGEGALWDGFLMVQICFCVDLFSLKYSPHNFFSFIFFLFKIWYGQNARTIWFTYVFESICFLWNITFEIFVLDVQMSRRTRSWKQPFHLGSLCLWRHEHGRAQRVAELHITLWTIPFLLFIGKRTNQRGCALARP